MSTPTPAPSRSITAARPKGVTILAVLAIIAGILAILAGLALMAIGTFVGAVGASDNTGLGIAGAFGAVAGVLMILYAVFAFAVAYGLFNQKRWAWYATIVMAGLQALGALASLLGGEIVSGLIGLAIAGLVGWYVLRPDVQAWFGVSYKVPWTYRPAPPHA